MSVPSERCLAANVPGNIGEAIEGLMRMFGIVSFMGAVALMEDRLASGVSMSPASMTPTLVICVGILR